MFTWWLSEPYTKVDEQLQVYATAVRESQTIVGKLEEAPITSNDHLREYTDSHCLWCMYPR
jgi:hypothetical protein